MAIMSLNGKWKKIREERSDEAQEEPGKVLSIYWDLE